MGTASSAIRAQVGQRVRELRLAYRVTQEQLAERAGLSYKFIGEIERGKANPTIDTLYEIARALRIEVHELLLTPGRETGPDALYRFGAHDVQIIREALDSATELFGGPLGTRNRRRTRLRRRQ
jgi:transcriptional regulator with XRE-family HTH domain